MPPSAFPIPGSLGRSAAPRRVLPASRKPHPHPQAGLPGDAPCLMFWLIFVRLGRLGFCIAGAWFSSLGSLCIFWFNHSAPKGLGLANAAASRAIRERLVLVSLPEEEPDNNKDSGDRHEGEYWRNLLFHECFSFAKEV